MRTFPSVGEKNMFSVLMENKHLLSRGNLRKQPLIVTVLQAHEKPHLLLCSWHGSLPEMEWEAHWELFWLRESQSSLAGSQPIRGLRRQEVGWLETIRSPQCTAVCVASLKLTVLPHVCLRAHNTGPFWSQPMFTLAIASLLEGKPVKQLDWC